MNVPERIKNAISNYNFFVNVYNEVVSSLDLSKETDRRYKWRLDAELQKEEISLYSTIQGYNICAECSGAEQIKLVPDVVFESVEIPACSLLFGKNDTMQIFQIKTYAEV